MRNLILAAAMLAVFAIAAAGSSTSPPQAENCPAGSCGGCCETACK